MKIDKSTESESQPLAHCRGLLRGGKLGCLSGVIGGPVIACLGILIGVPLPSSEIGPLPLVWDLGFFGLILGTLVGWIIGSLVDLRRDRDLPSLFAAIGVIIVAGSLIVLIAFACL